MLGVYPNALRWGLRLACQQNKTRHPLPWTPTGYGTDSTPAVVSHLHISLMLRNIITYFNFITTLLMLRDIITYFNFITTLLITLKCRQKVEHLQIAQERWKVKRFFYQRFKIDLLKQSFCIQMITYIGICMILGHSIIYWIWLKERSLKI